VLPGFGRAHAQLHRVIVHASLMAARSAFDCTLAFLSRIRVEHQSFSTTVRNKLRGFWRELGTKIGNAYHHDRADRGLCPQGSC